MKHTKQKDIGDIDNILPSQITRTWSVQLCNPSPVLKTDHFFILLVKVSPNKKLKIIVVGDFCHRKRILFNHNNPYPPLPPPPPPRYLGSVCFVGVPLVDDSPLTASLKTSNHLVNSFALEVLTENTDLGNEFKKLNLKSDI